MPLRIASVPYLNAAPLVAGLDRDPGVEFRVAPPRMLARWLGEGGVDAALLPVVGFGMISPAVAIPAGCVSATGACGSVRLFHRKPLDEVRTLAGDPDSVTSNALARIVLASRGLRPAGVYLPGGRDPAESDADAFVLIGDPCLEFADADSGRTPSLDLAEAWVALTGVPAVFAIWAAPSGAVVPGLSERLVRAREEGTRDLAAVAAASSRPFGFSPERKAAYLSLFAYGVGDAQRAGIRALITRAATEGLAPAGRTVAFLD